MPKMIHPDVSAVADVVDEAGFHAVWAPRGWELLGAPEAFATEILGEPVKDAGDLKADQLRALVSARGLEYPGASAKKDAVLKTFLDTFAVAEGDATPTSPAPAGNNEKDVR